MGHAINGQVFKVICRSRLSEHGVQPVSSVIPRTSILGFRFLPWVSTMASLLRDCDMQSKPDKPSPSWVALGQDIYHSDRRQRQHSKIAEGERKGRSVFSATSTLWTLFYESIYYSYIKHVIIYL